jgi:histidinol dehydrogenase
MLSQAEHDELSSAIFVTTSIQLAEAVQRELKKQLETLSRKEIAKKSLARYGAIIVVRTMTEAAALSNSIAPEHLEIMARHPKRILSMIRNAGAIFLGEWTPEALGDYSAGPNHTLPTGGTARFFSPLGVYDFLKRSSLLAFSKDEFYKLAQTVKRISSAEGLDGHKNTIIVRELYKG